MKTRPIPGAAEGLPEKPISIAAKDILNGLDLALHNACNFAKAVDYLADSMLTAESEGRPCVQAWEISLLLFVSEQAQGAATALEERFEKIRSEAIKQGVM